MKSGKLSVLDVISIDPLLGLHYLFSLLLVIPALVGFQAFEAALNSIAGTLGLSLSTFFVLFAAPTVIEISQTLFRVIADSQRKFSLKVLFTGSPAIFWLSIGIYGINLIEHIAAAAGVASTVLYLLLGSLPFYPMIVD